MDDSAAIKGLEQLGLTTYEARVYLALQKLGSGTASEISGVEDIPRSQVYAAAKRLGERGLIETRQSTPTVYRSVPLEQGRSLLLDEVEQTGSRTFEYLESVYKKDEGEEQSESIWLLNNTEPIVSRTVSIIDSANNRLLYCAADPELLNEEILDGLARVAADGGISILASEDDTVLAQIPTDSGIRPILIPETLDLNVGKSWALLTDGRSVLLSVHSTGTTSNQQEIALWTSNNPFATILFELIQHWLEYPFE